MPGFVPSAPPPMHRLGTLLAVLALGACASGGSGDPFDGGGRPETTPATREVYAVRAFNPSFNDVTIFVVNAYTRGARVRVGRLGASQEREFEFRMSTATREVRFELEYFSGPVCLTDSIILTTGDVVELILPGEPRNERGCR